MPQLFWNDLHKPIFFLNHASPTLSFWGCSPPSASSSRALSLTLLCSLFPSLLRVCHHHCISILPLHPFPSCVLFFLFFIVWNEQVVHAAFCASSVRSSRFLSAVLSSSSTSLHIFAPMPVFPLPWQSRLVHWRSALGWREEGFDQFCHSQRFYCRFRSFYFPEKLATRLVLVSRVSLSWVANVTACCGARNSSAICPAMMTVQAQSFLGPRVSNSLMIAPFFVDCQVRHHEEKKHLE